MMDSTVSISEDQNQAEEKIIFGKPQEQWLACLGPCMLTFGFPFLIPGISLTCVGFIENANVEPFGGVHTLGLFCLFIAVILMVSGCVTYCLFRPKVTPIPPGFVDSTIDLKTRQRGVYIGSPRSDYFGSGDISRTLSIGDLKRGNVYDHVHSSSPVPSVIHPNYSIHSQRAPGDNLPFYITPGYEKIKHADIPPEPVVVHSKRNPNSNLQNGNLKIENNKSTHSYLESVTNSLNKVSASGSLYHLNAADKGQHISKADMFNTDIPTNIYNVYSSKDAHRDTVQRLDTRDQGIADLPDTAMYKTDDNSKPRQTSSPKHTTAIPTTNQLDVSTYRVTSDLGMTPSADDGYDDDIRSDDTGESLTENSPEASCIENTDHQGDDSGLRFNLSGLSLK